MATAKGTSGLSPTEREILQAEGDTDVGQDGNNFLKYRNKIKNKVHPTLTDGILLLKHCSGAIDIEDFILLHCKDDLVSLNKLTGQLLEKLNH